MSITFGFYADAGLTVPLTTGGVTQIAGGGAVDRLIYFGSPASGKQLQAVSDPGVAPVQVSVVDANPDSTIEASAIRLALSSGGLGSATPGAALTLGTTLNSGAGNAVAVYVRTDGAISTPGTYTDLALRVAGVVETEA